MLKKCIKKQKTEAFPFKTNDKSVSLGILLPKVWTWLGMLQQEGWRPLETGSVAPGNRRRARRSDELLIPRTDALDCRSQLSGSPRAVRLACHINFLAFFRTYIRWFLFLIIILISDCIMVIPNGREGRRLLQSTNKNRVGVPAHGNFYSLNFCLVLQCHIPFLPFQPFCYSIAGVTILRRNTRAKSWGSDLGNWDLARGFKEKHVERTDAP